MATLYHRVWLTVPTLLNELEQELVWRALNACKFRRVNKVLQSSHSGNTLTVRQEEPDVRWYGNVTWRHRQYQSLCFEWLLIKPVA